MVPAPVIKEICAQPQEGQAFMLTCADGVRVRVAVWNQSAEKLAVIFQGRTEFIEKYEPVAQALVDRGYGVVAIDWRGQGLSDRMVEPSVRGHVDAFSDYQLDVEALEAFMARMELPRAELLIAHSMGGCIGWRAIKNGFACDKVIFSGPMWGINMPKLARLISKPLIGLYTLVGKEDGLVPGFNARQYVLTNEFDGNSLTNNAAQFNQLKECVQNNPKLEIGGPSINWVKEALAETKKLTEGAVPPVPCLCVMGTKERIVDQDVVRDVMGSWDNGTLVEFNGAQHELFIEEDHVCEKLWQDIDAFLAA